MLRFVAMLTGLLLSACAGPGPSKPQYASREDDPMYQEIKRLVTDQGNCFSKEGQSKSLAHLDLQTAA
jgi:hypothetical protein